MESAIQQIHGKLPSVIKEHYFINTLVTGSVLYLLTRIIYNLWLHPLSSYSGPFLARSSRLWYIISLLRGELPFNVHRLHEKYGEVVRIAPDELAYINADAWKDIYGHRSGKGEVPKNPLFYQNTAFGMLSIIGAPGERHGQLRRLLSHGFSEMALREQEPTIQRYADLLMERLHQFSDGGRIPLDMVKWYNFFTFDVIGDLAYGESFNCLAQSSYHPWVTLMFGNIKAGSFYRAADYYQTVRSLLWRFVPKGLDENRKMHMRMSTEKARQRLKMDSGRTDLVSRMTKPDSGISEPEFIANTSLLIIAGSETTATLLSGITYYLVQNPRVLEKLVYDVRSTFSSDQEINFVNVSRLKYMLACLDEAFRMYPPVPGNLPRKTNVPETLFDKFVPANTAVSVFHYAMYRSPRNFTRPDEFIPERWLDDPRFSTDNKASLQPFSIGPRNCLGRNLAYLEMRIILAKLLFHFDIEKTAECEGWDNQKVFTLWEKTALMIKLRPVMLPEKA